MMDNDQSTAATTHGFHGQEWGELVETPAESPDMNPIEHLWGHMKVFIRRRVSKDQAAADRRPERVLENATYT